MYNIFGSCLVTDTYMPHLHLVFEYKYIYATHYINFLEHLNKSIIFLTKQHLNLFPQEYECYIIVAIILY